MARLARAGLTVAGLVAAWAALVGLTGLPAWLLPGPDRVAAVLVDRADVIARHAGITLLEIVLGLVVGLIAGSLLALALAASATPAFVASSNLRHVVPWRFTSGSHPTDAIQASTRSAGTPCFL